MRKTYPRREVQAGLINKGFKETNADHLKYIYYSKTGHKTSVWTKVSRGTSHKDISRSNLKNMAKQCRLCLSEFCQLIECPLSRDDYENKLVSSGDIYI